MPHMPAITGCTCARNVCTTQEQGLLRRRFRGQKLDARDALRGRHASSGPVLSGLDTEHTPAMSCDHCWLAGQSSEQSSTSFCSPLQDSAYRVGKLVFGVKPSHPVHSALLHVSTDHCPRVTSRYSTVKHRTQHTIYEVRVSTTDRFQTGTLLDYHYQKLPHVSKS